MALNSIIVLNMSCVWEGLIDHKWTDSELLTLRDELASFHPAAHWSDMLACERQWDNGYLDASTHASLTIRSELLLGSLLPLGSMHGVQKALTSATGIFWTEGLVRDNQLFTNRWYDAGEKLITPDGRWHPGMAALERSLQQTSPLDRLHYSFGYIACPGLSRAGCRVAVTEACLREAEIAIALERYRRKQSNLPDSLAALIPNYLAAIALDPLGQPVKYQRESADAYNLTSLGNNGISNETQVEDVWSCEPKNKGRNLVVWHGLAPETTNARTASR
jgi:hypothetical protein